MFVTYILYSRRVTTRSLVSLTKREKNARAVLANFPRGLFIKPCARRAKCMHAETRFGESSSLPPHRAGSIYAKATIGHEIQFVRARARTMGEIPIRARERESIRRIVGGKIIPWKFRDKARAVVCVCMYMEMYSARGGRKFFRASLGARAHDTTRSIVSIFGSLPRSHTPRTHGQCYFGFFGKLQPRASRRRRPGIYFVCAGKSEEKIEKRFSHE